MVFPNQKSQATGIITQISSMLSSISLDSYHFDTALVLRNPLFLNSILRDSEVWHNVQPKHTQALEKSDLMLLRKIVNGHSKTALEAFYLEFAVYPIKFQMVIRRLMFLWHVLHRDTSELIRKIYEMQKLKSCKGDWVLAVEEDKVKFGITESDCEITAMSKEKFKSTIREKIESHVVQSLNNIAEKLSKSQKLLNYEFKRKAYI